MSTTYEAGQLNRLDSACRLLLSSSVSFIPVGIELVARLCVVCWKRLLDQFREKGRVTNFTILLASYLLSMSVCETFPESSSAYRLLFENSFVFECRDDAIKLNRPRVSSPSNEHRHPGHKRN